MSDWDDTKLRQCERAMAALPGTQMSQTGTTYRVRNSVDGFEDMVIVGRIEVATFNSKTGQWIVTLAAVDLTDEQIDLVLADWAGRSKCERAFAVRD